MAAPLLEMMPRQGDKVVVCDKSHALFGRTGIVQQSVINAYSWWVFVDNPESEDETLNVHRFEKGQIQVIPRADDKTMVEHIFRRYDTIRVQTLMDCISAITLCNSLYEAREILEQHVLNVADKALSPSAAGHIKERLAQMRSARLIKPTTDWRGSAWSER